MKPIFEESKKIISGEQRFEFSSLSGFHLVIVTARVKGEKQISPVATDDEDLIIQIDDKTYPKLNQPNSKVDSPAAFSGGKQHDLSKTIYFLTYLQGKDHIIVFKTDKLEITNLEKLEVYKIDLKASFEWDVNNTAEDGDRRAWITFVLDNLPLQNFTARITYSKRQQDSDDVKVIIDGEIQKHPHSNSKYSFWWFIGSLLGRFFATEDSIFTPDLSKGLHYIEFYADRMPVLKKIIFNFGSLSTINRIPTVNDPKWTENFNDDSDEIILARLIVGEMEGQSKNAKVGAVYTVINRLKKQNKNWGLNIKEIILKKNQYDAIWNEHTYNKVRDPLKYTSEQEWRGSYEIAVGVLSEKIADPTSGATHFYSTDADTGFPSWATRDVFRIKIGRTYFYELDK